MRASEAHWRALALRSADVAFLANAGGDVLFVTPSLTQRFGYTQEAMLGQNGFTFFHPDDEASVRAAWERMLALAGSPVTFRGRVRHADGQWRWIEETATSFLEEPDIGAVVANLVDVTDTVHAEQRAAALTNTDALTGIMSRSGLISRVDVLLAEPLPGAALVLLNLDQFQHINAEHGYLIGDEVLVAVARRLQDYLQQECCVARLAGDQFALLLRHSSALRQQCEQIAAELRKPLQVGTVMLQLTATFGAVALRDADCTDCPGPVGVLSAAERALGHARTLGPGGAHVGSPPNSAGPPAAAEAARDLQMALATGQIMAFYQPIIDLRTGRAIGVEALARWQHPQRGLLLPADFLPLAEASGFIRPLGEHMLRAACLAATHWTEVAASGQLLSVSVNLSPCQISQPGLVDLVSECLASSGLAPERLILEVTESAVMDDLDVARGTLRDLRRLGVGLALDDFGTGYSSLTYLKQFPLTRLKIDRSFTAGMCWDADDTAIVTSVLQLARSVGLECTAEGVETSEQADLLTFLGCSAAQGWLYSKALSEAEVTTWLAGQAPATPPPALDLGPVSQVEPVTAPFRESPIAARMRALQNEGASLNTIAAALNAEGLFTPDGKRWKARSAARTLSQLGSGTAGNLLARSLPALNSTTRFDLACAAVIKFLGTIIPLGSWMVTRFDGNDQVLLHVWDATHGLRPGDGLPWERTVCQRMIAGKGPMIAPDLHQHPGLAAAPVVHQFGIGAYVGIPLRWADGRLFGTMCALSPDAQTDALHNHAPMLNLLAALLTTILEADHERTQAERERSRAELMVETDPLTGLFNRRAWRRLMRLEEERGRRFGDPGAVLVIHVDGVKERNGDVGPRAGDEYLRLVARALTAAVRPTDLVARLGGDEFGVLVPNTDADQSRQLLGRIQAALDSTGVSAAFGYAPHTRDGGFSAAWEQAQHAMRPRQRSEAAGAHSGIT